MEKWIEDLFNETILNTAADRYEADVTKAKKLGDFENYVYEVHRDSQPYILRLTHSSHRSKDEVEAELNWINYLHENGITVSLVHHSSQGNIVEEIQVKDSSFYVCLFDKAPGESIKVNNDLFGPELYKRWGQITGKMHRVSKNYEAKAVKRARWDEDDLLQFESYLSPEDQTIVTEANQLVSQIKSFPEDNEVFGLIHSDIHPGNFFYHEGDLYIFDFDDSTYHYFVSDIAIPLYYSVWFTYRNESLRERSKFGTEMLTHFLSGYLQENHMSDEWLARIPLFLKLRDYDLYTVFHKKFDKSTMDGKTAEMLKQIRDRILRKEQIVDLDYDKIIAQVRKTLKDRG